MRRITVGGVRRRLARYKHRALSEFREWRGKTEEVSPVDFESWIDRKSGRRDRLFPDAWRSQSGLHASDPARIAVVMHVHFPDLVHELVEHLAHIPVPFDLFVTNSSGKAIGLDIELIPNLKHHAVLEVQNHGRDIFPLIQVVNAGFLAPYELVCKIHTKKSEWRAKHDLDGSGDEWKNDLLTSLLGSPEQITRILNAFATDRSLGQLTSRGSVLGKKFWGADLDLTRELLRRLEMSFRPSQLRFAAGSMYWTRAFVLQGLRSLNLSADDFDEEDGKVDGTTAHAVERAIGLLTYEAGLRIDDKIPDLVGDHFKRFEEEERTARARFVPFYLPQFHPFEENNRWWGEGFTEWTNVTAAKPVYKGHYQPKLPTELGFYDLRLDDIREQQAQMAHDHGVNAFMYYYYWFAGRRLMSRPIEKLHGSETKFPYCIMWANENWTRRWDGRESDILIGQDYDKVPAASFIDDVIEFLSDPAYLRVDGKAVLAVYRPGQMNSFPTVVEHWRQRARDAGVGELLVLSVDVAKEFDGVGAETLENGLDGRLGFPPHNYPWQRGPSERIGLDPLFRGNIVSYPLLVAEAQRRLKHLPESDFPGTMIGFDNTARRQWHPDIWYGSNPYTFHRWLAAAADAVESRPADERIVFINAWNEWAEGTVLEPTDKWGRTYLQALRSVAYS